jgi:hypothetical protein
MKEGKKIINPKLFHWKNEIVLPLGSYKKTRKDLN